MLAHPFTLTHPFNLCTMASCLRCVQVRVVFVSDTRGRHWHLGGAALELPAGDIFIHGGNMVDNGRSVRPERDECEERVHEEWVREEWVHEEWVHEERVHEEWVHEE